MAVIEDVSDVVRSNRLAAWAEMARIIAHEIKNPLTPIRLSVEHLREVWRRKSPDFERVLEDCVAQRVASDGGAAALGLRVRETTPGFRGRRSARPTSATLLRDAAAAYSAAPGVRWVVEAPAGLEAMADPRLLSRVLSNLVGNSVDALKQGRPDPPRRRAARRAHRSLGRRRRARGSRRDPARGSSTPTFRRRAAGPGWGWRSRRRSWKSTAARSAQRIGRKGASASASTFPPRRGNPLRGRPLRETRVEPERGVPAPAGLLLLLSLLLVDAACRKGNETSSSARAVRASPPKGDAVWFTDPAGAIEAGMEERLARVSATAVFLPAGRTEHSGRAADIHGRLRRRPVPSRPLRSCSWSRERR